MSDTGPVRIQLRRTKGWRKPDNTVVVARPSWWGNPYKVGDWHQWPSGANRRITPDQAVSLFRELVRFGYVFSRDVRELRGKNLACWCPLDSPCHADVLLDLANRKAA